MREQIIPTVLFVDDQPEVTAALELAFYKKPFKVHTANSASDALNLLSRVPIDVVVSDEQMPVMTGSQFLTIVRRDYPGATRIILSGQANFKATLAAINEARAHHFLVKPCPPDEIATCIEKALDERTLDPYDDAFKRRPEEARLAALKEFDLALEMLWVAFQPIIRSGESDVFAYEALVRTNHLELNSPYLLFDAAEEFGRVEELERRIRGRIAERVAELPPDVSIMVNIHPRSLTDEDLYSPDSVLFEARHRIIFEITERDKFHEVPGSSRGLRRLRDMGYRVAVDDLGAGYAGLNSFAIIKPDVVKFDMELIRDIDRSKTKCNLVKLMTGLCREMGILTVAEGIETEEEYEKVRELGCDLLQGFYVARPASDFSRPAPATPEFSEEVG
jgi:EAL domain-containing protein (putative c-di-GMP-specific phosphodiesterase class I)/CheY-like chemotaxis protein